MFVDQRLRAWRAAVLLLLAAGCAGPTAPVASVPPIPPGAARLWFYRVFAPDDKMDMPAIWMNGRQIGYALAGTSFYRDAPPGSYHLSVTSDGTDVNQSKDVLLAPGQQLYVKIDSLSDTGAFSAFRRVTNYVLLPPPQIAALELPQTRRTGGN